MENREIKLGGKTFVLKQSPLGVVKKVTPMLKKFKGLENNVKEDPNSFDENDFDMVIDIAVLVLAVGNDGLTKESFEKLPITLEELFGSLPSLLEAAGFVKSEKKIQETP